MGGSPAPSVGSSTASVNIVGTEVKQENTGTASTGGGSFTVYRVTVTMAQHRWEVKRRYSQFDKLNSALWAAGHGPLLLRHGAAFPGKYWTGSMSASKVKKRRALLTVYLRALGRIEQVLFNPDAISFLGISERSVDKDGGPDGLAREPSITEFDWCIHRTGGAKGWSSRGGRRGSRQMTSPRNVSRSGRRYSDGGGEGSSCAVM